ncbi:hypothetical protein DPMN_082171 [Dreissena polymorpha]|uniref:Uncharacterized protein n=1 Tax=Dreissena polymorpha TaxID=45954 RepID=A0A9D3Y763_DREPO|nr:hypothetical protein DPMN_082171 [Dreissena polymorpha]
MTVTVVQNLAQPEFHQHCKCTQPAKHTKFGHAQEGVTELWGAEEAQAIST